MSIEFTAFGAGFIPICLLAMGNLDRLLCLTLLVSAFEAASVLNITLGGISFGIQPAYFSGGLLCLFMALGYLTAPALKLKTQTVRVAFPLILFVGYAIISSFLLPRLFQGAVRVWPQRLEPNAPFAVLLAPSSGNTTQSLYLLLSLGIFICALLRCLHNPRLVTTLLKTYLLSSLIVVLLAFWQLAGRMTGLPYPSEFLYSNPTYAMLSNVDFGGLPRLSGPMTEAASLAYFLSGTLYTCSWLFMVGDRNRLFTSGLLSLTAVLLALATSTTGYTVAAIGVVFAFLFAVGAGKTAVQRSMVVFGGCLLALLAAIYFVPLLSPHSYETALSVVDQTLSKGQSQSYEDRTSKDADALFLVLHTYGLGAGWGSVRASSLFPTVVGATGVWGIWLVIWFAARVYRLVKDVPPRSSLDPTERMVSQSLVASLLGILVAALISGPNLTYAGFWINLGGIVGLALWSNTNKSRKRVPIGSEPLLSMRTMPNARR
jgi:hypothetical protein